MTRGNALLDIWSKWLSKLSGDANAAGPFWMIWHILEENNISPTPKKHHVICNPRTAAALAWLFVDRFSFAWRFHEIKHGKHGPIRHGGNAASPTNSSTDLDLSKRTIGVKTPWDVRTFGHKVIEPNISCQREHKRAPQSINNSLKRVQDDTLWLLRQFCLNSWTGTSIFSN